MVGPRLLAVLEKRIRTDMGNSPGDDSVATSVLAMSLRWNGAADNSCCSTVRGWRVDGKLLGSKLRELQRAGTSLL